MKGNKSWQDRSAKLIQQCEIIHIVESASDLLYNVIDNTTSHHIYTPGGVKQHEGLDIKLAFTISANNMFTVLYNGTTLR